MLLAFVLALTAGLGAVLQAGMQSKISESWGLPAAGLFNTLVILILTGALIVFQNYAKLEVLNPLAENGEARYFDSFKLWYFIPGICGFIIIFGLPIAIAKIGALRTFLFFVCTQIVISAIWDLYYQAEALSLSRIVGALLCLTGAILAAI